VLKTNTGSFRRAVTLACLAAVSAAHAADSSSVQARWDAIARCAPLVDDGARHACLDDVLRQAGLMPDAARAAASRQRFGLPAPTVPVPAAAPSVTTAAVAAPRVAAPPVAAAPVTAPTVAAPAVAAAAPAAKPSREDLIQVTLAGVNRGGDGALVLNTTEGAVWRQIEPADLHPEPVAGDTLTIKHTLFGGYMCQSRKWIVFRCVRTR
jgi:hypothetical protein